MPKFNLACEVTVSAYTAVEADSLEEAIRISGGREIVIGGVGTGADVEEQWIIDDPDGSPENIHAA